MTEKLKHEPNKTRAMAITEGSMQPRIHQVVDTSRFSSKGKLLRTIAWVKRFANNLRSKISKQETNIQENLKVAEINEAEILLIRSIQSEAFPKEISYLVGGAASKPPLHVNQFNLFLDNNNVLRCRTRVGNASIA